jgi:4-amino-4-deoxychorismate lyase
MWLDGAAVDGDWGRWRALHYGDGIFRTCLIYGSHIIDFKDHILKLEADSQTLGLIRTQRETLCGEMAMATRGHPQAVLKVVLFRSGTGRGYRPQGSGTHRLLLRYDLPQYPGRCWTQGVIARRSAHALAEHSVLAGVKHLNRLPEVLASRDWPAHTDEVLVQDQAGRPVCGSRSNLFWVRGGQLCTPALSRCGVAGIMRSRVLAQAQRLQMPVRIGDFEWSDVDTADEIFLTNSLIGLWPVRRVNAQRFAAPGAWTRKLGARLQHPLATF